MLSRFGRTPSRPVLDALVALWCAFWVAGGVLTGHAVWQLGQVTGTVQRTGEALDDAGQALQSLADLPVVGGTTGTVGDEVRARAQDAITSAQQARDDVQRLALLLGTAVALLPTAPLLAVYLPGRMRLERDVRDVRRVVTTEPQEAVDAYLALRALTHLPVSTLCRYTPSPVVDAQQGRHAALAAAELDRLGLRRVPVGQADRTPAAG